MKQGKEKSQTGGNFPHESTESVTVTYSRTVNIGNFESVRIEMGQTVSSLNSDPNTIRDGLYKLLRADVSNRVREITNKDRVIKSVKK